MGESELIKESPSLVHFEGVCKRVLTRPGELHWGSFVQELVAGG